MKKSIAQSCDSYYYHFAQKVGFENVANFAKRLGMGQQFPLPVPSQFYGTVPSPSWYEKKYEREWTAADTVNSSIGQGYYLSSPLQLAVMTARLATGVRLMPRLVLDDKIEQPESLGFKDEHIEIVRQGMSDVVNGGGTARRARLPFDNIKLAGKTGTAQVVSLSVSDGKSGPWKYRDHGLFVCFAPFDNPRYACAVVIEHGGGSGSAYPVARDVLTYIYDRRKAMESLISLERGWGGTIEERMERKLAAYRLEHGFAAKNADPETESEDEDQSEAENEAEDREEQRKLEAQREAERLAEQERRTQQQQTQNNTPGTSFDDASGTGQNTNTPPAPAPTPVETPSATPAPVDPVPPPEAASPPTESGGF